MPITDLADRLMSVYRRTSFLLDPVDVSASHAADRQPGAPARVRIRLSGGAATGTVTVSGTTAAGPASEVLTFTGPGVRETVGRFISLDVPALATSGLDDEVPLAQIQADAIGADGSAIHASYLLASGWPFRMDIGTRRWPTPLQGSTQTERLVLYLDPNSVFEPREGDALIDDRTAEQFRIEGSPTLHGGGSLIPHHYEIQVKRHQGAGAT